MNEEIKKNEIRDDELENVSGGANMNSYICNRCKIPMMMCAPALGVTDKVPKCKCPSCGFAIW